MGRLGETRLGTGRLGETKTATGFVRMPTEALAMTEGDIHIATDSAAAGGGTGDRDGGAWTVNGTRVLVTGLKLTHDEVKLAIRTLIHTDIDSVRALNSHAGEVERLVDADGGWTTVDRSLNDDNTFSIAPPIRLMPALQADSYHVERYREDAVSEDGSVIDADVTLVRTGPRTDDGSGLPSQSQGSGEWLFNFHNGKIATPHVRRTDQGDQADIDLELELTETQVEALLESATYLDAVSVQSVPDGDDFIRDGNPDDRNTVTINQPNGINSSYLPTDGGDYAIRDWTATYVPPSRYEVEMTVRELP